MQEINQLIHCTSTLDNLKSILKNGIHTSYASEIFTKRKAIVPMISFSNILFRDLGELEVVNYGNYGISIERDSSIEKYGLNPVIYYKSGDIIEESMYDAFYDNLHLSLINMIKSKIEISPETPFVFSEFLSLEPKPKQEIIQVFDNIDITTSNKLIESIYNISQKNAGLAMQQLLLSKPLIVKMQNGSRKVAYNEREWRKSYLELGLHFEYDLEGNKESEYENIVKMKKPHLKEDKYTMKIPIADIQKIFVKDKSEIDEILEFIQKEIDASINPEINTLKIYQELENTN
jgi:hypothetical protein